MQQKRAVLLYLREVREQNVAGGKCARAICARDFAGDMAEGAPHASVELEQGLVHRKPGQVCVGQGSDTVSLEVRTGVYIE